MECPDIHKFLTNTRHRSHVRAGKIGDPGFKESVRSDILRLGGVTGLSLVLPPALGAESLASHLASALEEDTQYYEVRDFRPALMFSKEFRANFVNIGTLSVLSQNDGGFLVQESLSFHNKTLNISLLHKNVNL